MRYQVISVSAHGDGRAMEEVNQFLAAHRVVDVDRRLIEAGGASFWTFCISYMAGGEPDGSSPSKRGKIDYREVLKPDDFAVYSKLRDLRRDLAQREGIPPYGLFTNEQLAAMVTTRVTSRAALAAIDGVGPARVEKYADQFLARLRQAFLTEAPADPGSRHAP